MKTIKRSAKPILALATACLLTAGTWASQAAPNFVDITHHWAKAEITYLAQKAIVKGTSATQMSPDSSLKGSEWQLMLQRLYLDAATPAQANNPLSRENAITMLYRSYTARLTAQAILKAAMATESVSFKDVAQIDTVALPAVEWAVSQGLVKGNPQGLFNPDQSLTRAEGMVMMYRFMNNETLQKALSEASQPGADAVTSPSQLANSDIKATIVKGDNNVLSLAATWGQKSTGGYSLTIDKMEMSRGALVVYITAKSPEPDAMVIQAITYPKASKEITLKEVTSSTPIMLNITKK